MANIVKLNSLPQADENTLTNDSFFWVRRPGGYDYKISYANLKTAIVGAGFVCSSPYFDDTKWEPYYAWDTLAEFVDSEWINTKSLKPLGAWAEGFKPTRAKLTAYYPTGATVTLPRTMHLYIYSSIGVLLADKFVVFSALDTPVETEVEFLLDADGQDIGSLFLTGSGYDDAPHISCIEFFEDPAAVDPTPSYSCVSSYFDDTKWEKFEPYHDTLFINGVWSPGSLYSNTYNHMMLKPVGSWITGYQPSKIKVRTFLPDWSLATDLSCEIIVAGKDSSDVVSYIGTSTFTHTGAGTSVNTEISLTYPTDEEIYYVRVKSVGSETTFFRISCIEFIA